MRTNLLARVTLGLSQRCKLLEIGILGAFHVDLLSEDEQSQLKQCPLSYEEETHYEYTILAVMLSIGSLSKVSKELIHVTKQEVMASFFLADEISCQLFRMARQLPDLIFLK